MMESVSALGVEQSWAPRLTKEPNGGSTETRKTILHAQEPLPANFYPIPPTDL